MLKMHRDRQLELLALTDPEATHALPDDARREVREGLRILLIEVVIGERGAETGDEQDHA
jgi:hypothetical protein